MKKFNFIIMLTGLFVLAGSLLSYAETIHTVQKGDTVATIASKYFKYTDALNRSDLIKEIKQINNIGSSALSVGQQIKVPVITDKPFVATRVPKKKEFAAKGVYMNTTSAGSVIIMQVAEELKKYGANTVVFDVKDDQGALTYGSSIQKKYVPDVTYTPNIQDLPKMVELLHRMNIHVVARVVVFKDPIMSKAMPKWAIKDKWLNPANKEVQDYILSVIKEVVDNGVDEIQLDYIRYDSDRKKGTGVEGKTRIDIISDFLKRVQQVTKANNCLLSMDMFGIVTWQRDIDISVVGQDVKKLKPYVDIISPMLYPSHFNDNFSGIKNPADEPYLFISSGVKRLKDIVGNDIVIRPWLQAFPYKVKKGFGPDYIRTQIYASDDNGGTGWLLWSPQNKYAKSYTAMQELKNRPPKAPSKKTLESGARKPSKTVQEPSLVTTGGI